MKKKYKIIIAVEIVLLLIVGAAILIKRNSHLAKFASSDITVDVSEPFDINNYLTDIKEGSEVTYDLDEDNSKLTVYLTKGSKEETLSKEVTLVYPNVSIPDDLTIDTYVDTDLNKFVEAEDGVEYEATLDEDTGMLTVTYTKGAYTNTISKKVTVTNSNPVDNVRFYSCKNIAGTEYEMVIYPDGTLEENELTTGNIYQGKWKMKEDDANNGTQYSMNNAPSWWTFDIWFSDDSKQASFFIGNDRNSGNSSKDSCELTKIETYTDDYVKLIDRPD